MGASLDGSVGSRPVAPSTAQLLGDGARREPLVHADGKSGGQMERVVIDGDTFVLKHLRAADDWIMRATGDVACRAITVWRAGWLDRLPACIDHAVVDAAWDEGPDGHGGVLLMRDVGPWLVPEGDDEIPLEQHLRFIDHMAQLHVTFWGWRDTIGLLPVQDRFGWFGPGLADAERARGGTNVLPTQLVPEGWNRLATRSPQVADIVLDLLDDPTPLIAGLATTPQTLVHGDWKAGNLGSHPDGRTILLDWSIPGVGPGAADIAWYVCLNRARLPQSKDDALDAYRAALERHGVDTTGWWEQQCSLSLLGTLLLFGWEKALGDDDEGAEDLAWWEQRACDAAERL